MPNETPRVIGELVDAINASDIDGFVGLFDENGSIDDWGTEYRGPDRIRRWAQTDAIGAQAHMEILTATTEGAQTTARFAWRSRVFTGESIGVFTVAGRKLASFVIRGDDA